MLYSRIMCRDIKIIGTEEKDGEKSFPVLSPLEASPWREEVVGSAEEINSIFYAFGSIAGAAAAFARKSRYMCV